MAKNPPTEVQPDDPAKPSVASQPQPGQTSSPPFGASPKAHAKTDRGEEPKKSADALLDRIVELRDAPAVKRPLSDDKIAKIQMERLRDNEARGPAQLDNAIRLNVAELQRRGFDITLEQYQEKIGAKARLDAARRAAEKRKKKASKDLDE